MAKTVLVINSGSSSIKYQLVDLETGEGIASGLVEKIGEPVDGHYKHEFNGEKHELEEPIHDHEQGLKRVLGFFEEYGPNLSEAGIVAVGHRVTLGDQHLPDVGHHLGPYFLGHPLPSAVHEASILSPLAWQDGAGRVRSKTGGSMSKRGRKKKARKKSGANHGKRPNS